MGELREPASSWTVAVAQFAPTDDREANRRQIAELVGAAEARGATLVVLPEYSAYFHKEFGPHWAEAAEPLDGPFVTALAELAARHDVTVVAGLAERVSAGLAGTDQAGTDQAVADPIGEDQRFSNTIVAVSPGGSVVATYRKMHLYDAFGQRESDWIVPGDLDQDPFFDLDGLRVGVQTCYDLRFPEVTRRLVDGGADLVLLPSEWVRGPLKEHHWRTLVTARAIENTVYVAAADHAPPIGAGNSLIVDPMGVALAGVGESTDVAVTVISRQRVEEVRAVNPALQLRRFRVEPRD